MFMRNFQLSVAGGWEALKLVQSTALLFYKEAKFERGT